eukprot:tig00000540_g1935.t1
MDRSWTPSPRVGSAVAPGGRVPALLGLAAARIGARWLAASAAAAAASRLTLLLLLPRPPAAAPRATRRRGCRVARPPQNYLKDTWSYSVFAPVLGHGLVSAEDELWKRQRQIIARSFDPAHLRSMLTIRSDTAVTLLNRWRPAPGATSKFDVSRDFRMLTLDVICRASFGMSFEDDSAIPRLYLSMMHEMNTRIFYPFRPFKKNEAELNRIVRKLIEDRRKDIQDHPDRRTCVEPPPLCLLL